MKTVQIDDDVYQFLLAKTKRIGESASEILRRLLVIPPEGNGSRRPSAATPSPTGIAAAIADRRFRMLRTVTQKFLFILTCLYRQWPNDFEHVTEIGGRKRKYFAKSAEELVSGDVKSVEPQRIPETPWWVVTNNNSEKKRRILRDVLGLIGVSKAEVDAVLETLV